MNPYYFDQQSCGPYDHCCGNGTPMSPYPGYTEYPVGHWPGLPVQTPYIPALTPRSEPLSTMPLNPTTAPIPPNGHPANTFVFDPRVGQWFCYICNIHHLPIEPHRYHSYYSGITQELSPQQQQQQSANPADAETLGKEDQASYAKSHEDTREVDSECKESDDNDDSDDEHDTVADISNKRDMQLQMLPNGQVVEVAVVRKLSYKRKVIMLALLGMLTYKMFEKKHSAKKKTVYSIIAAAIVAMLLKKNEEAPLLGKLTRGLNTEYFYEYFKKFVVELTIDKTIDKASSIGEMLANRMFQTS